MSFPQVERFIQSLVGPHRSVSPHDPPFVLASSDERAFGLTQQEIPSYRQLIQDLSEIPSVKEDFSEHQIRSWLDDAIVNSVLPHRTYPGLEFKYRLRAAMSALEGHFAQPMRVWDVYFPVENLDRLGLPFAFGKVQFQKAGRRLRNELLLRSHAILRESPNSPSQKIFWDNHFKGELARAVQGRVVALVKARAVTGEGARAEARRELRFTLDVLNFYADILRYPHLAAYVFLPGEALLSHVFSPAFDQANEHAQFEDASAGPLAPMILAGPGLAEARRWGFDHVSELLSVPQQKLNSLQSRTLAALRWAGRATTLSLAAHAQRLDSLRAEPFLYYAIALESLLSASQEKAGVTDRLSLRCALILQGHPYYSAERNAVEAVRARMISLYAIRSAVVHEGRFDITPEDSMALARYAKHAILAVLLNPRFAAMTNDREFERWCDERAEVHRFSLKLKNFAPAEMDFSQASVSELVMEEKRRLIQQLAGQISTKTSSLLSQLATILAQRNP